MPRIPTQIDGPTAFFSTRHFRKAHRDALRSFGAMQNLNLDEALDEVIELGLPLFKQKAVKAMRRR